ncbi:hypothetical protein SORBI_3004G329201 [Sorghum bicolor]|uniref:Cytochrome c oxidase copper chaperone n=1 Tax=Sorghum bicolor TaxID=4558 RepID=A0A1Z5RR07_SORBI|nr:hypothetical protein SORBI_3004G329201 [Sorghum bicolor]
MQPGNGFAFASRGHSPATSVGFASRGHSPSMSVGRGGHFAGLFAFFSFLCGKKGGGREEGHAHGRRAASREGEKPRHDCTRQAIRSRPPPLPHAMSGGSATVTAAAAPATESKPKKKICCACPDTKRLRDECVVEHGEPACTKWIEAHKRCLRAEGFNV